MELTIIVISASKRLTSTVGITYECLVSRLNDITVDFTCVRTLRVACVRPRMYTDQCSRLRTATDSKSTPSRTIPWGSVKPHAKKFLYASSHAKHGSSNASEIDCIRLCGSLTLLARSSTLFTNFRHNLLNG